MKKYTKPSVEILELSVKESLSDLPGNFGTKGFKIGGFSAIGNSVRKNVTMYVVDSGNKTS